MCVHPMCAPELKNGTMESHSFADLSTTNAALLVSCILATL